MNNGKICVSVCAETTDEFIENIKRAEELADVIELRFDCLKKSELEPNLFEKNLSVIFKQEKSKPFLSTYRPKEQGGKRQLTKEEREYFWNSAYDGCWADLEEDVFEESLCWLYHPRILSHHDFAGIPENLIEIYQRIKENEGVDIIKIAAQTNDISDTIAVWKLLERAEKDVKKIIPIAMGESGVWTRILGLAHGAFMTYAALEGGKETASGQIVARDLIETYRVKELDAETEIYGIVGNPVAHSLSPFMHNAALASQKRNAVYIPFAVKNLDEFIKKFIREETREVELNFRGFSVTAPHKTEIIKHLDSIDDDAKKIGAVNTVKIVGEKLFGFNTDARGFVEPLKTAYGDLNAARVAILGAGGAARACAYALEREKADVTIFARDAAKAQKLAAEFGAAFSDSNFQNSDFKSFDIIVNATPLGTRGALEYETPLVAAQIEEAKLIYDLIYNPFETRFIKEARKANVPTLGGLAMLVAQGAKQFEIWTCADAPVKLMSAAALKKLK